MKKWHPCMFIPLLRCGKGETGTELLNSVAPVAKAPYNILKGVFQDPLSDSALLLASPFSRQPSCHDGWQCPGVMPGSCTSPLCALCWSPLRVVCLYLLFSPLRAAVVSCCFVPWRKPILFCSYQRKNKSRATRKNMECKHVFPGHQHAGKHA